MIIFKLDSFSMLNLFARIEFGTNLLLTKYKILAKIY